jgi:hypothetical protein
MNYVNTVDIIGEDELCAALIEKDFQSRGIMEFYDDRVKEIGWEMFSSYASNKGPNKLVFPNLTGVIKPHAFFKNSWNFKIIDLGNPRALQSEAFKRITNLVALVIRGDTICTMEVTSAISDCPIASGTGYIYVPRALLSDTDETKDYRRATNWSTFAAQFRALEDYTVDGTTTGELDETKI